MPADRQWTYNNLFVNSVTQNKNYQLRHKDIQHDAAGGHQLTPKTVSNSSQAEKHHSLWTIYNTTLQTQWKVDQSWNF